MEERNDRKEGRLGHVGHHHEHHTADADKGNKDGEPPLGPRDVGAEDGGEGPSHVAV
jgi:hypothetical protein